eukprot:m.326944 g.326944  ORF g.326944 m.326944 type:complete len:2477 (-) comp19745_c14_seq3:188-7618(-)
MSTEAPAMSTTAAAASASDASPAGRFKKASKSVVSLMGAVDHITQRRNAVLARWEEFKDTAAKRRSALEDSRRLQQFLRDADEVHAWIDEKMQIATDEAYKDTTNLQGKIKKHEAFEAEVMANEDAISGVRDVGEQLIKGDHYAKDAIQTKVDGVMARWGELKAHSEDKGIKLRETQQLVSFKREADEVSFWIADKAVIASSNDVGRDLEHVEMLQKKFEDFSNDLSANEPRVEAITDLRKKLVAQNHPQSEEIQARTTEVEEQWRLLKEQASTRKTKLANAREIHTFNQDADELSSRITEKEMTLSSDDDGKDLASVEALQRKHDGFTRDLAALEDSVQGLERETERLSTKFPDNMVQIKEKQGEIATKWTQLQERAATRKKRLDDSYDLQRFLNDFRNALLWINDMKALVQASELAKDVAGADALLQRHQEHKGEIVAREDSFVRVVDFGEALLKQQHYAADELKARLAELGDKRTALWALWNERQTQFEQCQDLQLFTRDADQIDAWTATQESSLATEDLGDSLDSVEALLKKHDDFEKSLQAQEEKTKGLDECATRLLDYGHYDATTIDQRRNDVLERRNRLAELASARRFKLEESRKLQQFKRDTDEAEAWITEKLQTASDESYRDPTNLRGKLQNHLGFEAELDANEGRIDGVNSAAQVLLESDHYAADTIKARQADLNEKWQSLRTHSKDKGQKLREANDALQFQRRAEDIDSWCTEVETALSSEELGKDLTSVQNLLKKHQLLEADIEGHTDRVSEVSQQAKEFIRAGNFRADEIETRQVALEERFQALSGPAAERRARLEAALKLQQFCRDIDDEESWIKEKEPGASSQNYGNSLTAVQNLQKKHNALMAELAGRQGAIEALDEASKGLVGDGHYASDIIQTRAQGLALKWQQLNELAGSRRQALEDSLKTQQYYADANEAEAWMTEKQPLVSHDDYGKEEDSALALLKKHEALEADLKTYQGTINALGTESQTCKDITAFETPRPSPMKQRSGSPASASKPATPTRVKAAYKYAARRKSELDLVKGQELVLVDKSNPDWWKVEGSDHQTGYVPASYVKLVETLDPEQPSELPTFKRTSSSRAMSRSASTDSLSRQQQGQESVAVRQASLENQYGNLLQLAAQRRQKLEESQQLYQLNREIDQVESWMNDREAIASLQDLGTDLEHNEVIQKKFDDFLKDLAANESRVQGVNELANLFVTQGHSDAAVIEEKRDSLNTRWGSLQTMAEARRAALARAHEIHKFNRDVDETKTRFGEKQVVLSSDDCGKDVASVETLIRKHDGAMRDLAALGIKVNELQTESGRLVTEHPQSAEPIKAKQAEVDQCWEQLQAQAADRKKKLDDSLELQQFVSDFRDIASWLGNVQALASSTELAKDASGAQALLKRHQELRTEVDARGDSIAAVQAAGKKLVAAGHFATGDVEEKLGSLEGLLSDLDNSMSRRKKQLDECVELHAFNRLAEQAESWISAREAPLTSEDVDATLDAVEAMQKKHADFEKSLAAQKEKMREVEREATRLCEENHYDAAAIELRKEAVKERWDGLVKLADERKGKLEDALLVQQFHRDADEAEAWMAEKRQNASDPSYKDPSNLQGKLQKHQAFEAEVAANRERIFAVIDSGRALAAANPADAQAIEDRIKQLEAEWASLAEQSQEKTQKLKEANEQLQFNHGIEDIELWLSEVEVLLASTDLGKDLPSVQNLMKKHQLIESDIAAKQDRIDSVNHQADRFVSGNHFDSENIAAKRTSIVARYDQLKERASARRTRLQESLQLQQVLRDIDDEETWSKEKERIAMSTDFGRDLTGVQNLQKKHQTFDAELSSHEPRVQAVLKAAAELAAAIPESATSVTPRAEDLSDRWGKVKSLSESRRMRLEESLQYQLFNADVDEEESWINEKQSMMTSEEAPDTLSGAQSLVKKHEAFEADLVEHQERVEDVCNHGDALKSKGNYQSDSIDESSKKLETLMEDLAQTAASRKVALNDRFKFLQFSREADSIEAWMEDKEPQVVSEEFGKDLPSVQSHIAKHDTFAASLSAFQPRINAFQQLKAELIAEKNTNNNAIQTREAAVVQRWKALLEASELRRAKLLRSQDDFQDVEDLFLEFAQKASQFNSWFENAEEDLTDPVRVNSLDEIDALFVAHQDFVSSLKDAQAKFDQLVSLDSKIKEFNVAKNPYTWFTIETIRDSWENLERVIEDREADLGREKQRQKDNEALRQLFAKHANEFSQWLSRTRAELVEGTGTLEAQLDATKDKHAEIKQKKAALKAIEDLGARMEEALILDNKHTEHSTVGLAQQWDQLEQLGMRMQHNLEQQIQAKNTTGVSEEKIKEFNETFRYFDKDRTERLEHQELKSCLRSLGYSFPIVEQGQADPEFEAILTQMDPNNDGYVELGEFMSFMISRETENVESATEVINAFRAAAGDKPYCTKAELQAALTPEQADYCMRHMRPYVDPSGVEVEGSFDYRTFTQSLFLN